MNITDKSLQAYVRQSQKDDSKKYHLYSIGNNLWFRVHAKTGNTKWLYRIALPDQSKKSGYKFTYYTIGTYPQITLLNARLEASNLANKIKSGINPNDIQIEEKKAQITIGEIWHKWISQIDIKDNTLASYNGIYTNHVSKIANLAASQITSKLVWDTVIQPIIDNKNLHQAKMVMNRIKHAVTFAYNTHLIDIQPLDSRFTMPTDYKIKKIRENTISTEELPRFIQALDKTYQDGKMTIIFHHLIKLILLLGTRKTELATAKWNQYNADKQTLLITNTKTGNDLLIKLPTQAIALIEELRTTKLSDYIFFGMKLTNHVCLRNILDNLYKVNELAELPNLTIHDLRRTFSSRLAGLGFRFELIEKATNHKLSGTAKHYHHDDMLEERYQMLQVWADYLEEIQ